MSPTLSRAVNEGRDELTLEEAERFANEQAREYLDLSIDDFRRLAESGGLSMEDPMVVHIALLAGVDLAHC